MNAIASIQSLRASANPPYIKTPQSQFGANFFTLANRSDINFIANISGKKLEGADLTGLGAGQAQWAEMVARNLSFWNLPSAVLFSHNQNSVALDVYTGVADVGMVRTDLLEGLQSPNCTVSASTPACFPPNTFKILEPKTFPGFQFNSSTVLYPEWPVAAMPWVNTVTQELVAEALFALNYSADPSKYTTAAAISTFTPPLAYTSLRDMQRTLGWIVNGSCITSIQTYDTIVCAAGTFKKAAALVNASSPNCLGQGLVCKSKYDCTCSPCQAVPPVELSVVIAPSSAPANVSQPCAKLTSCATVLQNTAALTLAVLVDNWAGAARAALGAPAIANVQFYLHSTLAEQANATWVNATAGANGTWSVALATPTTGFILLDAMVNGVSLSNGPFVLNVVPITCRDPNAGASADGQSCVCLGDFTLSSGGVCAKPGINVGAAVGGAVGGGVFLIACFAALFLYMHHRAESVWRIPLSAIKFAEPPEVLGRGTFGLVVKGTFRGTTVALKRTLPAAASASTSPTTSLAGSMSGSSLPATHIPRIPRSGSSGSSISSFLNGRAGSTMSQFDMQAIPEAVPESPSGNAAPLTIAASLRHTASAASSSGIEIVLVNPPTDMGASTSGAAAPHASMSASGAGMGSGSFSSSLCLGMSARRRNAALRADFVQEMRLVVHLRHPHVTTVMGAVLQRGSDPILVMECMGRGSLYDLLHNDTLPLDGDTVLPIVSDVISGVAFLHAAKPPVLHNDLKSANILIDSSFRAKVADFGLSGKSRATGGQPGTPPWMAPELLRREGRTTTATDVYAFGITLSEIFSRADPYEGTDLATALGEVARGPGKDGRLRRPVIGGAVPPLFGALMRRCWAEAAGERPSMADIMAELKSVVGDEAQTVTSALLAAKTNHNSERALLHSVFPAAVAAALAAGRRVEPQSFDTVTVFFSDIVGFTDLCSKLTPSKVMALLDRLYQRLDALCAEHALFKVETIGDAFMCCGGIREGQEADHCARIAAFALDACAAAAQVAVDEDQPDMGCISIRAGFHCGPVVASVVGRDNPRYCLFGDTVNTASRMESSSEAGRVNLSAEAALLLRAQCPAATLASRGAVAIKGKGTMALSFLLKLPIEAQSWRAWAPVGDEPPTEI